MSEKRTEALDRALQQIEKAYGKGASCNWTRRTWISRVYPPARVAGPRPGRAGAATRANHRNVRSGVVGKDHAGTAGGGLAQRLGGIAAVIDAEHALSRCGPRSAA